MANRSVQLYLYAELPGTGWRYCRAVFGARNNIKPHVLLRPDGTEELHPEAVYYLSYRSGGRKVWENLGNNPSGAMRALEKKRACLAYVATGGTVLASETESQERTSGGQLLSGWKSSRRNSQVTATGPRSWFWTNSFARMERNQSLSMSKTSSVWMLYVSSAHISRGRRMVTALDGTSFCIFGSFFPSISTMFL